MKDFDQQLQQALKRREPPRDLTASIIARIDPARIDPARIDPPQRNWWGSLHWVARWVPATVALAAMLIASVGMYRLDQYRKGQQAKRQVMLALQLTARKLAVAQRSVNELSHRRIGYE